MNYCIAVVRALSAFVDIAAGHAASGPTSIARAGEASGHVAARSVLVTVVQINATLVHRGARHAVSGPAHVTLARE